MENNNQSMPPAPSHRLFQEPSTPSDKPVEIPNSPAGPKNYNPVFWNLFALGWVLSVALGVIKTQPINLIILIFTIIWIVYFVKTTNEAWKAIGKSNGWLLGLLTIIPFGFWIVFFVVRHYLKPKGMWVSKNKSFQLTK